MIEEVSNKNIIDVNKSNQPHMVIGELKPEFRNGEWTYLESLYDKPYKKSWSDDDENYEEYIDNSSKTIFLFYENEQCVGQNKKTFVV